MKSKISNLWAGWKKIATRAMDFQAKIILWLIYFTILIPLGFWFKTTHDVLRQKKISTNWQNWQHLNTINDIKKM